MAFGNRLGINIDSSVKADDLFAVEFGNIVAEVPLEKLDELEQVMKEQSGNYAIIGTVTNSSEFTYGDVKIKFDKALATWEAPLEKVFPTRATDNKEVLDTPVYNTEDIYVCRHKVAKPTVFIPVFPGTNCEYDSTKAFEQAGADVIVKVFRNLNAEDIRESVNVFEQAISQSQIIMFPGGFSAGDEPDGSAKFFATAFQNAKIKEAVNKLSE